MAAAATAGTWETMELVIVVKAYPAIGRRTGEGVCVAGIRIDTVEPEWVRLFPVGYRDLPEHQRFAKFDRVRLRARPHPSDRRRESYRPDLDSLEVVGHLSAADDWRARREFIDPLLGPTMCELNQGRVGGARDLQSELFGPQRSSTSGSAARRSGTRRRNTPWRK